MNKRGAVRRLIGEMTGKYRFALIFVFIFIFISTFANVASSFFIQRLIDDYIGPLLLEKNPVFTGLLKALAVMALIYLLGVGSTLAFNRIMVFVSQGVQKRIRDNMFSHMQSLPIKYFDTNSHGDIMSRYTNDIDALRDFFALSLPQIISSIFTIITVTVAMLTLSKPLSAVAFAFVAITLVVSRMLGGASVRRFVKQQASVGRLNGYIREMIAGQRVIKVFCHEDEVLADFKEKNEELRKHGKSANQFSNVIMPIVMNIGAAQYVGIAIAGGMFALNGIGGLTLGTIAAFLTLSRSLSAPIAQISAQVNAISMAMAGAGRIFELMDEAPEDDSGYATLVNARYEDGALVETREHSGLWAWKRPGADGGADYTELRGDVRFSGVDFGYVENKRVLRDISLYAKPGQKIAFVGATGAGKTTIANLLNRFYDIDGGSILYDGINIKDIKKADLRRSLGVVLQETRLFTGTVADNIRYGKPGASDEEVREAARLANADDFITRLTDGYDTMLDGDGGNLSGGQRQLLSIARAAAADPPVMILDEATSSIDTRTEAIVQRGMDSLMEGRTVFVIAHRLSTVRNAKAILVMEQGEIIERGDHEDLMEAKGRYHQLYTGAVSPGKREP